MRRHFLKLAVALAVSGALSTSALAADPAKPELVFGTTVGDFGDMVKQSIKPILEKQGYKVRLVEFTDYVRPNLALADFVARQGSGIADHVGAFVVTAGIGEDEAALRQWAASYPPLSPPCPRLRSRR